MVIEFRSFASAKMYLILLCCGQIEAMKLIFFYNSSHYHSIFYWVLYFTNSIQSLNFLKISDLLHWFINFLSFTEILERKFEFIFLFFEHQRHFLKIKSNVPINRDTSVELSNCEHTECLLTEISKVYIHLIWQNQCHIPYFP